MQLHNERLTVDINAPGSVYRGTRFDWSAFITQVTLDGRHTFCVPAARRPEDRDAETLHVEGLCNEFGIFAPVGYDEAKPDEQFPKLGVGLLTRLTDKPYSFMDQYPVNPFPMEVSAGRDAVTFTVRPLPCRGYAALLKKTVALEGTRLSIRYALENVGAKPLVTHEYNHNFISINRHHFGPDYRLTVPFDIELDATPEPLAISGGEIRWTSTPTVAFYCRPRGFTADIRTYWELIHAPSGVGVRSGGDFPLLMFALWGIAHTVCPETFIGVHVQPGATQTWQRWYEFFEG